MTDSDTIYLEKDRRIQSAGILKIRGVLVVLSDNFLGMTFILDKILMVMGRDESCDIQIEDPLISKKHCTLFLDPDGHFMIEDMGSTNSTYLNGKVLKKPVRLSYGDRIITGNTVMRFFHEEKFESK
jgi:pSer/pThr/pTyr-binding forkhead associated (FHA) protein